MSTGCRMLLENGFFFEAFKRNELDFDLIKSITINQAKNLTTAVVTHLIYSNLLTIEDVLELSLSDEQRAVLNNEHILQLVKENRMDLDFICSLNDEKCKNISVQTISYLILQGFIDIEEAMNLYMTDACRAVLNHETYFRLVKEGKLNLQTLLDSQEYCDILLKNETIAALNNHEITIETLLERLKNPLVSHLLQIDVLTASEIPKIEIVDEAKSHSELKLETKNSKNNRKIMQEFTLLAQHGLLFESNLSLVYQNLTDACLKFPVYEAKVENTPGATYSPILFKHEVIRDTCLRNIRKRLDAIHNEEAIQFKNKKDTFEKVLSSLHFFKINSPEIWSHFFSLRLINIYQDFPHKIKGEIDTVDRINREVKEMGSKLSIPPADFAKMVLQDLLQGIMKNLEERRDWDSDANIIYQKFSEELAKVNQKEPSTLFHAFENIVDFARCINQSQAKSTFNFFKPVNFLNECSSILCEFGDKFDFFDRNIKAKSHLVLSA